MDPRKVTTFIKLAAAIVDKAASVEQALEKTAAAVNAKIPTVVDVLIARGHILPTEKDAAATALANPLHALTILERIAGNPAPVPTLGSEEKTASAISGGSQVTGTRPKAWGNMERALGVT